MKPEDITNEMIEDLGLDMPIWPGEDYVLRLKAGVAEAKTPTRLPRASAGQTPQFTITLSARGCDCFGSVPAHAVNRGVGRVALSNSDCFIEEIG